MTAMDARMRRLVATIVLVIAGCATPPVPLTPPAERRAAPVVRDPMPAPARPPLAAPAAPPSAELAFNASDVPPGAAYVCVSSVGGQRRQVAIAFDPKVDALCRRHPEMGPCQYERNLCRSAGGRVFTAAGTEITMATEAQYDRKVMRVRLRAD